MPAMVMKEPDHAAPANPFVSRGGLKLAAALDAFVIDPTDLVCADLGCNVGGFTDCLLQRGSARVYAVDTGYGTLAWKLRQDPRVVVLERTNAIHLDPATLPAPGYTGCDLVTVDLAWTRQCHAIPAALRWLRRQNVQCAANSAATSTPPRIITLIKPHYEADKALLKPNRGVLEESDAQNVLQRVLEELAVLPVRIVSQIPSPIRGGASRGRVGNMEFLALLELR